MLDRSLYAEAGPGLHAVFVAAEEVLARWAAHLTPSSGVLTLTDIDLARALHVIAERQPPLVIIEQRLAASARGAAMLACLRGNPTMSGIEVQVLSAERSAAAMAPGALLSGAALTGMHLDVERSPIRRAPRLRVPSRLRAVIDGNPAAIVDFSMLGAQVLSPTILRPNQRVRVTLVNEAEAAPLRASAGIAWSSFERSRHAVEPQFRAGMEFSEVDPQVRALYERLMSDDGEGRGDLL